MSGDVEDPRMATDSQRGNTWQHDLPGAVVEDILDSQRRRLVLACLADSDGAMVVGDIAAAVCAREGVDSTDHEMRAAVERDIYERHLPKLTATGVVEYDSMRGAVDLLDEDLVERL